MSIPNPKAIEIERPRRPLPPIQHGERQHVTAETLTLAVTRTQACDNQRSYPQEGHRETRLHLESVVYLSSNIPNLQKISVTCGIFLKKEEVRYEGG